MELQQLRYFVAVARLGNFTRAAERCRVSQPSLSQQIGKLERELGEQLLLRQPGGKSVLTPAGELLLERAHRILTEVEEASHALLQRHETVQGEIRVGAIPTIAPFLLVEAIVQFSTRYPDVKINSQEATTRQLLQQLESGELDFAVLSPPLQGGPWRTLEIGREPLFLALRADSPLMRQAELRLGDLREENFILMREGHCLTAQIAEFCDRERFSPKVRFQSAQVETLRTFIRSGMGVSLLPAMAWPSTRQAMPELRFRELAEPSPERQIVAAWRPDQPLSRACHAFLDGLARVFTDIHATTATLLKQS